VSSTLSALVPAATYYIRLWTRDGALNWSALSNAATAQSTIFPPSAPAGFTATALSTGSIRWSWTDAADNESGYRVLSDTGGVIVDLPANTTCWLEGDLAANTSWYRCAETYNAAGSSAGIAGIAVTFANYPTDTVFTGVYLSSVSFQWSANDNPPNTVWGVYRSTDNFTASTSTLKSFGAGYTATSYDDTGLLSDASYYYKVRAFNGSGIASAFGVIISTYLRDRIPPQAVTTLTAQAGAQAGKILLTWSAPGDDGMIGPLAAGSLFGIQYSTDPATAWSHEVAQTTIAAADFPPFTVVSSTLTALVPGTTYYIRLWTRDGALNWSALSNGATAAARIAPPAQPSGLYGTALSTGAILWNWPDAFSGETQYLVCSSTGVLAPLPADTTAYLETDLQENSAYERYLRVQSVGGESAPSLPAYRRTLARAPQGISVSSHTAHSVMLLWEQGAAAAFRVDISSDAVNWTTTASSITSHLTARTGFVPVRPGTSGYGAITATTSCRRLLQQPAP
jgi:hypothetical protein